MIFAALSQLGNCQIVTGNYLNSVMNFNDFLFSSLYLGKFDPF